MEQVGLATKKSTQERLQEIQALEDEVTRGRSQVNNSQGRQNCFLEYEALARLTNENHPQTSRNLQQQIQTVQKQVAELEEQQAEINQTLRVRESQFQLFLQYMLDLKRTLNEEDDVGVNKGMQPTNKKHPNDDEEGAIEEEQDDDEKLDAMEVDDTNGEEDDGLYGDL
jgi:hypothetical protein